MSLGSALARAWWAMSRISHAPIVLTTMMVSVLQRIHKGRAVDPASMASVTGMGAPGNEKGPGFV